MHSIKVGDKVVALNDIIDGDCFVCARKGDVGTVVSIEDVDAFDVDWPHAASITGLTEVAPLTN